MNGLTARDYLVKKGRAVRASDMAFMLINSVPAAVAGPDTTVIWEQALTMIETGELTLDVFIAKQAAWISQLIARRRNASLPIKIPHGPACPLCNTPTHRRSGRNGPFWSCSQYLDCGGALAIEPGPPKCIASRTSHRRGRGRKGV